MIGYFSWKTILPYTSGKLKNVIRKEISQKRPLFLHFANLKNFGHSVVIDGYKQNGKQSLVHLNQGQGGSKEGWYDFDQDLLTGADRQLRLVYTFKSTVNRKLQVWLMCIYELNRIFRPFT